MMKYYVNITPPKNIFKRVKQIEQRWQGDSASDPHLTLMPPRRLYAHQREERLVEALKGTASGLFRFILMVTLAKVECSKNKEHIYIRAEKTPGLEGLQETIDRAVAGILEQQEWNSLDPHCPHITLASHLTRERGVKAWKALKNEDFAGLFTCTEFSLLRRGPEDKRWEIIRTFETA